MSEHLTRAIEARKAAVTLRRVANGDGEEQVPISERVKMKEESRDLVSAAIMHAAIAQAEALERMVEHITHPHKISTTLEGTSNA